MRASATHGVESQGMRAAPSHVDSLGNLATTIGGAEPRQGRIHATAGHHLPEYIRASDSHLRWRPRYQPHHQRTQRTPNSSSSRSGDCLHLGRVSHNLNPQVQEKTPLPLTTHQRAAISTCPASTATLKRKARRLPPPTGRQTLRPPRKKNPCRQQPKPPDQPQVLEEVPGSPAELGNRNPVQPHIGPSTAPRFKLT